MWGKIKETPMKRMKWPWKKWLVVKRGRKKEPYNGREEASNCNVQIAPFTFVCRILEVLLKENNTRWIS